MYETLHSLHSYTLTSGAPVLASIVHATLIGREQFGHFGNRGFTLQTHSIRSSLCEVTPGARKGSDVLPQGKCGIEVSLPVHSPSKYRFIINLKPGEALGHAVPFTLLARTDEVIKCVSGTFETCPPPLGMSA